MTSTPTPHSRRPKPRLSRRGVLGTAGAIAAGATLAPAVFAAGGQETRENGETAAATNADGMRHETFPKTRSTAATGTSVVETSFPVGYVGVRWTGEKQGAAIRFADTDGKLGDWQELPTGCAAVNAGGVALVPATAATKYQVQAPDGATSLHSLALDTAEGPGHAVKVATGPTRMRGLRYLSRAAWGCDESKRFKPDGTENSPTKYSPVQTITVHHTVDVLPARLNLSALRCAVAWCRALPGQPEREVPSPAVLA